MHLVWRSGGGTRFDSRGAQVTFLGRAGKVSSCIFTHVGACGGTLLGRVEVTFWAGLGHFFVIFGMSWEVSGSVLGMCLDRFGKVLKTCPTGSENCFFFKMIGSILPESGRFRIAFLTYPRSQQIKISKTCLLP